jgi:ribosomal protein S18 acetylase RimI-like enzyme
VACGGRGAGTDRAAAPTDKGDGPTENRVPDGGAVVCDQGMTIVVGKPGVDGLGEAVDVLREWQCDAGPVQLHPGDLGWFWRFGAEATAAAVRTWRRDGRVLAVGLLDGPGLLRMTIASDVQRDEELARRLVEDLAGPERGVLPEGRVFVEAPMRALVQDLLVESGWEAAEPWTPLRRDLTEPVEDPGVRIGVVGPEQVQVRTAVQRAAFEGSTFTDGRWRAMAAGSPYADARCLVAYDDQGAAVAAVTVWSAGPGKPGLLEPMGVHRDHRGRGYGKAITVAAAAALRELGSSSAVVCTPSSNAGAVATYESAGFQCLPEVRDLCRGE